jgi:hypothetical protein
MSLNPTEWAALIAAAAAIGGGVLGGAISYKVTDRQVASAESLARCQRAHELQMAREDRDQRRKSDACITVLTFILQTFNWVQWMRQKATYKPELVDPEPSIKVSRDANAIALLYLSTASIDVVQTFNKEVRDVLAAIQWKTKTKLNLDKALESLRLLEADQPYSDTTLAKIASESKDVINLTSINEESRRDLDEKYKELTATTNSAADILKAEIISAKITEEDRSG